jgi:hypothetical protein
VICPTLRALATAAALLLPLAAHAQAAAPDSAAAAVPPSPARAEGPDNVTAAGGANAGPRFTPAAFRPLAAGDQVRLVAIGGRYSGTLTQVTADTITLAAPGRTDAVVRADVSHIQRLVSRESRGRSILRGAGLGLLAGAALGYVGGSAAGGHGCAASEAPCSPGHDRTAQAAFAADGAILGALLGAMLGPTFRRSHWERVDAAPAAKLPAPSETASGPR